MNLHRLRVPQILTWLEGSGGSLQLDTDLDFPILSSAEAVIISAP